MNILEIIGFVILAIVVFVAILWSAGLISIEAKYIPEDKQNK